MPEKETLLIDGHVHIYPQYDLNFAIKQGIANLRRAAAKCRVDDRELIPVWLLTERYDCSFFDTYKKIHLNGMTISASDEAETLIVTKDNKPILYIIAGRQIVTRENLEVLSLMTTLFFKDREFTMKEVIDKILDSGGLPAINWAPGKWFFARGKVVEETLNFFSPEKLLIGDTSLRTTLWPMPKLMAQASSRGFKIIAGSDPLPFDGEENQIGRYAFSISGDFDKTKPAASIRALLKNKKTSVQLIGKRNHLLTFGRRQFKIMLDK